MDAKFDSAHNRLSGHYEALNYRTSRLGFQYQSLNSLYEALNNQMNSQSEALNNRINALNNRMNDQYEALNNRMNGLYEAINNQINNEYDALNNRMNGLYEAIVISTLMGDVFLSDFRSAIPHSNQWRSTDP
ncbi:4398_t:CDS:1, partial [Paraglomus occultum]